MNFKKKRSLADCFLAAFVFFVYVAVPVWGFMVLLITNSALVFLGLLCWVSLSWLVSWRFEHVK